MFVLNLNSLRIARRGTYINNLIKRRSLICALRIQEDWTICAPKQLADTSMDERPQGLKGFNQQHQDNQGRQS